MSYRVTLFGIRPEVGAIPLGVAVAAQLDAQGELPRDVYLLARDAAGRRWITLVATDTLLRDFVTDVLSESTDDLWVLVHDDQHGRYSFETYVDGRRTLALRSEGETHDDVQGTAPPGRNAVMRGLAAVRSAATTAEYLGVFTDGSAWRLAQSGRLLTSPEPVPIHAIGPAAGVSAEVIDAWGAAAPRTAMELTAEGYGRLRAGDVDGALEAFADAIAREPGSVPPQLARLDIFAFRQRSYIAAVAAGRALHDRGIGGVGVWRPLAVALQGLAQHREAIGHFERSLSLEPEREVDWYNLACSSAKHRGDLHTLIALDTAIALLPENAQHAREDDDFANVRSEAWFTEVTDPDAPRRRAPRARFLRLVCSEASRALVEALAPALETIGYRVSIEARRFVTGDDCAALCASLVRAPEDHVFVAHDHSAGARWMERELPVAAQLAGQATPVSFLVQRPSPSGGVPSLGFPEGWGAGALGLLRLHVETA